jgi:asparagine synthase (glutamine-hydrolysing)
MSALAGLWRFDGRRDAGEACGRMLAAQEVYGPHGSACWDGGAVALGRRLFKTVPEDAFDRQPLNGGGGRFTLVADARLDNRGELTAELRIGASEAARLSDAAIVLLAWERWGEALFGRLLGDYAFVLWDAGERRLLLARDAMGAKPLHYHRGRDGFAFASMPKGLHALPEIPIAPDEVRAAEFLALMPEYGPRSFFEGICRVEPGQRLAVTPDGLDSGRHWRPSREIARLSERDQVEGLRHHLDRAVEARLRGGGGRVAAHLSAGLDSSAIAATAARLDPGARVVAFTSVPREGYDGAPPPGCLGDESSLAAATAALYPNIEHVRVPPDGRTVLDDLDRDFFLFERPLVNACTHHWLHAINAEAGRRRLPILLSGMMGNFTISHSGLERLPELASRGRVLRLWREWRGLAGNGEMSWPQILAATFGPWTPAPVWSALKRMGGGAKVDIGHYSAINPDRLRELRLAERAREQRLDFASRPWRDGFEARLWGLRRIDWGNYGKGVLAGWGVDIRYPATDRRLVEFCLSLPSSAFLADGRPRSLARRAFADRLAEAVLRERRRGAQAIDWHESMTASQARLRDEIERLSRSPAAAAAVDLPRARRLVEDWPTGGWNTPGVVSRYRLALLRGVVSGHFLRRASRSGA